MANSILLHEILRVLATFLTNLNPEHNQLGLLELSSVAALELLQTQA